MPKPKQPAKATRPGKKSDKQDPEKPTSKALVIPTMIPTNTRSKAMNQQAKKALPNPTVVEVGHQPEPAAKKDRQEVSDDKIPRDLRFTIIPVKTVVEPTEEVTKATKVSLKGPSQDLVKGKLFVCFTRN